MQSEREEKGKWVKEMDYTETQILISIEWVEQIERQLFRLIREGTVPSALIHEALKRRDLAVEEVQKWQRRLENKGTGIRRLSA